MPVAMDHFCKHRASLSVIYSLGAIMDFGVRQT